MMIASQSRRRGCLTLKMLAARAILFTSLAMIAFAGNSILCRVALRQTEIDPASFTLIRLVSGALTLGLITLVRRADKTGNGSAISAAALFIYAVGFSFAYVHLAVATGALILFG